MVKIIKKILYENEGDRKLQECASIALVNIKKVTACTSKLVEFFIEMDYFKPIFNLMQIPNQNPIFCGNMAYFIWSILKEFGTSYNPEQDKIKIPYNNGDISIILDIIYIHINDRKTVFYCGAIILEILTYREPFQYLDKIVINKLITCSYKILLNKDNYIDDKGIMEIFNPLIEKLGFPGSYPIFKPNFIFNKDKERFTETDIKNALKGLKIENSQKGLGEKEIEDFFDECKKAVTDKESKIKNNHLCNEEEAIAINMYTSNSPLGCVNMKLYEIINKKLRENDMEDQIHKKSYTNLLLRSLRKIPRTRPQTLYRAVKKSANADGPLYLTDNYEKGEILHWSNFTSTSTSMHVAHEFIKGLSSGTLFIIENGWGYSIKDFSSFEGEKGKTRI